MNNSWSRSLIPALFCTVAALLCNSAASQTASPLPSIAPDSTSVTTEYWVFDCGGRYLRVSEARNEIVDRGRVAGIESSAFGCRTDGCLLGEVRPLSGSNALIAVTAVEPTLDASGRRHHRVVSLDRTTLKMLAVYTVPGPQTERPRLLLNPSSRSAAVLFDAGGASSDRVAIQELVGRTLQLRPSTISKSTAREIASSRKSHILADGRIQTDSISHDGRPGATFASALRTVVDHWQTQFPQAGQIKYALADSISGKSIYIAGWDTWSAPSPNGGVILYDVMSGAVISSFRTAYKLAPFDGTIGTPNIHLTPNGDIVVIEEYAWRQDSESTKAYRFKTGSIVAYDAQSGMELGKAELSPEPSASARVIGFSEDGRKLFYASFDRFYIIDLAAMRVLASVALPEAFTAFAAASTR